MPLPAPVIRAIFEGVFIGLIVIELLAIVLIMG
jgi:hypothetical protein